MRIMQGFSKLSTLILIQIPTLFNKQSVAYGYTLTANTKIPNAFHNEDIHNDINGNNNNDDSKNIRSIPWLIIGGGIHGVHIAARLIGSGHVQQSKSSLAIIDDCPTLLHSWKIRTSNTGMKYLRSSAGYHLDLDVNSLRSNFNNNNKKTKKKNRKKKSSSSISSSEYLFTNDYERPRLDIFNQHCDSIITKYELDKCHVSGKVISVKPNDDNVLVQVSLSNNDNDEDGSNSIWYKADNIILAIGNDNPSYADWVNEYDIENGLVRHLLDVPRSDNTKFNNDNNDDSNNTKNDEKNIAIIGGGITAAHKALELSSSSPTKKYKNVYLISRHPIKEQQFDTHQDWMMDKQACERSLNNGGYGVPKRQAHFNQCNCLKERRDIIRQERIPGTVTPEVNRGNDGLRYAIQNGNIQYHESDIIDKRYITTDDNNIIGMELVLSCGKIINVNEILLATGFGKKIPGGKLIQKDLIQDAGLKVSDFDGYPIVNEHLLWHKRIFVAGGLAELELGPSARNIAGARLAAERILQAIQT